MSLIDSYASRRVQRLDASKAARISEDIRDEYALTHDGASIDIETIHFGTRNAVSDTLLYSLSALCLAVFVLTIWAVFDIPQKIWGFVWIATLFLIWMTALIYRSWHRSGFILCSDVFCGIYWMGGKHRETTPSRIRRLDFSRRYLSVTCASGTEDFMLPLCDKGYLAFLDYLEPLNPKVCAGLDMEKIRQALHTDPEHVGY